MDRFDYYTFWVSCTVIFCLGIHQCNAHAGEIPPWQAVDSFCQPLKLGEPEGDNVQQINNEELPKYYILCYGPYFIQQAKYSLDSYEDLLRTKNELDLEKKKSLVKSSWPSVWWFIGAGVAILAAGGSSYLIGRYAK